MSSEKEKYCTRCTDRPKMNYLEMDEYYCKSCDRFYKFQSGKLYEITYTYDGRAIKVGARGKK